MNRRGHRHPPGDNSLICEDCGKIFWAMEGTEDKCSDCLPEDEVEANRCYFCGVSDPNHNPEDCADLAEWEREMV